MASLEVNSISAINHEIAMLAANAARILSWVRFDFLDKVFGNAKVAKGAGEHGKDRCNGINSHFRRSQQASDDH